MGKVHGVDTQFAVRAHGIRKCFADVVALDGVNIDVMPGEVHGLIGPNGAGKTTLLGLLLGLAVADAGTLSVLGLPVRGVLGTPEGVSGFVDAPAMYPWLTARQNLVQLAALRERDVASNGEAGAALERVGLARVADERVHGFSLGMRQRLGLAASMLLHPRLLVLDEPSNGLDPAGRRDVQQVIADLARGGTAVVISSHRMDDIARQCTRVTLLSVGRVVFDGQVAELAKSVTASDYRIVATDPAAVRERAERIPGLRLEEGAPGDAAVVVHGGQSAVDRLVAAVVGAGVAIRELGPEVPPLEAAFLNLTEEPAGAAAPSGGRVGAGARAADQGEGSR